MLQSNKPHEILRLADIVDVVNMVEFVFVGEIE
jgi:hypothetical protein